MEELLVLENIDLDKEIEMLEKENIELRTPLIFNSVASTSLNELKTIEKDSSNLKLSKLTKSLFKDAKSLFDELEYLKLEKLYFTLCSEWVTEVTDWKSFVRLNDWYIKIGNYFPQSDLFVKATNFFEKEKKRIVIELSERLTWKSEVDSEYFEIIGQFLYVGKSPVKIIIANIFKKFKFHFDSKNPTNRLDKPEWYLSLLIETYKDHSGLDESLHFEFASELADIAAYKFKKDFYFC